MGSVIYQLWNRAKIIIITIIPKIITVIIIWSASLLMLQARCCKTTQCTFVDGASQSINGKHAPGARLIPKHESATPMPSRHGIGVCSSPSRVQRCQWNHPTDWKRREGGGGMPQPPPPLPSPSSLLFLRYPPLVVSYKVLLPWKCKRLCQHWLGWMWWKRPKDGPLGRSPLPPFAFPLTSRNTERWRNTRWTRASEAYVHITRAAQVTWSQDRSAYCFYTMNHATFRSKRERDTAV